MDPVVIVGSGLAGYQSAKEIRRLDREVPLLLVSMDSGDFYSKPMLSNAFSAGKDPDSLVIKSAAQMAAELDAEIRTDVRVDGIFPGDHEISIGGEKLRYARLVLAFGADPLRLHADALSVNDLSGYARFRKALEGKKRVAIIGAGLVGCEFADDLSSSGFEVDVFDIANQPLGRLVTPECGKWMETAMKGIAWHWGAKIAKIEKGSILLEDGSAFQADIVLSAVGLKPRVGLAQDAGLECARGILVNRRLETSARDVYAIGDCMEIEGQVLPFVMPIMHASKILARNVLGERESLVYPAMPVVVKTPSCPAVVSPPKAGSKGAWHTEADAEGVKSVFLGEDGKMLGFALCGKAVSEKNLLAKELPAVLS